MRLDHLLSKENYLTLFGFECLKHSKVARYTLHVARKKEDPQRSTNIRGTENVEHGT